MKYPELCQLIWRMMARCLARGADDRSVMGRRHALRVNLNRTGILYQGHGEYWMNLPLLHRLAMIALIPAAAIWLGFSGALAQSPSAPSTPAPPATAAPA